MNQLQPHPWTDPTRLLTPLSRKSLSINEERTFCNAEAEDKWFLDSGATRHVTNNRALFTSIMPDHTTDTVKTIGDQIHHFRGKEILLSNFPMVK